MKFPIGERFNKSFEMMKQKIESLEKEVLELEEALEYLIDYPCDDMEGYVRQYVKKREDI